MKKPKLAILGSGNISHFHIQAFNEAGFEISHIAASNNSKTVKEFAKKYSVKKVFMNPKDLFNCHDEWDLVLVAISTEKNKNYFDSLIKLDKPCLIEKPVSTKIKDFIHLTKKSYPLIRVAYNRRFYATIQHAKEFIKNNGPVYARLELPEVVKPKANYYSVLNNSAHGIDLLLYLFSEINIVNVENFNGNSGRLVTFKSIKNDLISLVMNWNSPSNFQLNIEGQGSRLEIKPFEKSTFYQGMEIVEPSNKVPVRTYIPKKISELNSFPKQKDAIKPGFLEQALEMKSILKGKQPKVSASLEDAFNVQKILDNILSN